MGFSGSLSDFCSDLGIADLDHNQSEHPTNGIRLSWNNWMYEIKNIFKKKGENVYLYK